MWFLIYGATHMQATLEHHSNIIHHVSIKSAELVLHPALLNSVI